MDFKGALSKLVQSIPSISVLADQLKQDNQKKIKILLVDDNTLFRGHIRKIIENQDELVVIGEASDGEEAVKLAHQVHPDVIVMDINMPRMNGIEATRIITDDLPKIRIIGLSLINEDRIIEDMKNAGAAVYLQKSKAHGLLVKTIRRDEMNLLNKLALYVILLLLYFDFFNFQKEVQVDLI